MIKLSAKTPDFDIAKVQFSCPTASVVYDQAPSILFEIAIKLKFIELGFLAIIPCITFPASCKIKKNDKLHKLLTSILL